MKRNVLFAAFVCTAATTFAQTQTGGYFISKRKILPENVFTA